MDRADRVLDILDKASSLSPAEVEGLLDRECAGDAALRAEVESLLGSLDRAGRFLKSPTGGAPPVPAESGMDADIREGPGTRIGPYKLLQRIGEGGFGTVFMAEQDQPVRRKVALKIVKLGMDTRQVVARFEQERQALAVMEHSNIASVLDAGSTETGRPFFVMELVKGDPIVAYCDKNSLSVPERLELFAQVCAAVQHAHTKGVIHRDIKPSNILVSTQDGRPLAKVIDFGIAKATEARLTEKTLFTDHRALIGTPEYMSPEQAQGSLDIDTRTDVYSLGVLLYELLTGTTPFSGKELRSAAYAEIQRIIREVEPPNPSTRLSRNTATIASVAAQRKTVPRRLGSMVRGELDWVVMKALEKDRARRYESASSLEADVRRYLGGEAVNAAPPGRAYRARKFVLRHKGAVASAAAVGLALSIGLAAFAWQASVAREQAREAIAAQRRESEQRQIADDSRAEALRQKSLAEDLASSESKARTRAEAINDFVIEALQSSDPTSGDKDTTILESMDAALKEIDAGSFRDDPETEARLRMTIGLILFNNGRAARADELTTQALALCRANIKGDDPLTASVLSALAHQRHYAGKHDDALALYTECLELVQRLNPGDHSDTAAAMNSLGSLLHEVNRLDEAESFQTQALEMRRRLFNGDNEGVANSLNNLGELKRERGKLPEAERLQTEALEMMRRLHPGDNVYVAVALNNVASIRQALGRAAEAEPLYVESLEMRRRLYGDDHTEVAEGLSNLAAVKAALGRNEEAELALVEAVAMYRKLDQGDSTSFAQALNNLGSIRNRLKRPAEAEPPMLEALEMRRRIYKTDHPAIAVTLGDLAAVRQDLGNIDGARAALEEAVAMLRRLSPDGSPRLGRTVWLLARLLASTDPQAAIPLLEEALASGEKYLAPDHPDLPKMRALLAECRQKVDQ